MKYLIQTGWLLLFLGVLLLVTWDNSGTRFAQKPWTFARKLGLLFIASPECLLEEPQPVSQENSSSFVTDCWYVPSISPEWRSSYRSIMAHIEFLRDPVGAILDHILT